MELSQKAQEAQRILNNVSSKNLSQHLRTFIRHFTTFNTAVKDLPPLDPLPTTLLHWWAGTEAQLKELWAMLTTKEREAAEMFLGKEFSLMRKWGLW